ncbi:cytochrome P450 [Mesobacterium sp. TK19101]|uniref:Cytochrome P450 n=1 Tax=Mesobacterium hydrothermale TaxID=3111907 RepID=A0ABU6HIK6_9RHOB|nr:cytochrome P450 [Mesobacterium sp. TK19101]MEC3862289.1 cytochrome P450 [Mesobacterium sp. TK19101]
MIRFDQSPTDPVFVQSPYPTYARMRDAGDLVFWQDYGMPCAVSHAAVHALLRDRRFGREVPAEMAPEIPAHLAPFYAVEAHSMLELEPPRHTRLRGLVLRAFTSRKLGSMRADIEALCHRLIDDFPTCEFELLPAFAQKLPVIVIARLLGVPEEMSDQLLAWSNAMVAMYQARRDRAVEDAASRAATEFSAYLRSYIDARRSAPRDDLITHLIAAEEGGEKLSTEELITTCILVLNAGHEATVHTIGNGLNTLLPMGLKVTPDNAEAVTEEIMRFDPPLHMFTRYAYDEVEVFGHRFRRGDQVGLMLASANRDGRVWEDAERFDPERPLTTHTSFGGGLHFCVGAPLARLELQVALPVLFERCPGLRRVMPGTYADSYHFHGLERLMVAV